MLLRCVDGRERILRAREHIPETEPDRRVFSFSEDKKTIVRFFSVNFHVPLE